MTQDTKVANKYRAKDGVVNELVFCLLGGFGITAELATAAFERCKDAGLFDRTETSVDAWTTELQKPFEVNRKLVKYRYPNQKARYLSEAMAYVRQHAFNLHSGRSLRDQLLKSKGSATRPRVGCLAMSLIVTRLQSWIFIWFEPDDCVASSP